jgi:hypothetical protein
MLKSEFLVAYRSNAERVSHKIIKNTNAAPKKARITKARCGFTFEVLMSEVIKSGCI